MQTGLFFSLYYPLPYQTLSGVFATNSGIAPHAALPHPLPPSKHVHHVWVWNGLWDLCAARAQIEGQWHGVGVVHREQVRVPGRGLVRDDGQPEEEVARLCAASSAR